MRRLPLVLTVVGLLCACGSPAVPTQLAQAPAAGTAAMSTATQGTATNAAVAQAAADAPATRATPATARPICTSSGPASPSWLPPWSRPAGAAIVSATTAGDTLTLRFDHGTPAFEVRPQASSRFSRDPSGLPVTLPGSAGAAIVLRGFRGDTPNYSGSQSLTSDGRALLQVRQIGDFEGVVTWAAGLSEPGCASVRASGSTLTIRFVAEGGKG